MFESLGVWLLIFWLVECVPSWKTNSFRYCTRFHFEAGSTLPKTNIGPENRAYQKDISSSNHHFAGAIVVSRIVVCHHTSWEFGGKLRNSADVLLTFLFGRYAGAMNYLVPRAVCFSVTSVQTNQGLTMVCSNIDVDIYIYVYIYSVLFIWMVLQDFSYQSPTFLKAGLKTSLWAPKVSDDRQWFKVGWVVVPEVEDYLLLLLLLQLLLLLLIMIIITIMIMTMIVIINSTNNHSKDNDNDNYKDDENKNKKTNENKNTNHDNSKHDTNNKHNAHLFRERDPFIFHRFGVSRQADGEYLLVGFQVSCRRMPRKIRHLCFR